MATADGSRAYIAVIKQTPSTPFAIPANPVLQKVNFTKDDLMTKITTKESEHIRADRMLTDINRVGYEVEGGYEFEFQYENSLADELFLAFLWCQQYTANVAKNGLFYQPFYIERGHTDIAQYFQFIGMAANVMTLDLPDQGPVTGSYKFLGLTSNLVQATVAGATYTDAQAGEVFSTVFHISELRVDNVVLASCVIKDMSLEINNNLTAKTGLGVLGACETKAHRLSVTGKMSLYLADHTYFARFKAGTAFSLSIKLLNTAGKGYTILLGRCKFNADDINVTGDEDVMENVGFTATYDSGTGSMIQVTRTP
jgi:Phage tail tube protein